MLFSIASVKEQDAKSGITMPPFHCHCRSTTVPYIEGLLDDGGRVARDPETGKTVEIPDMTYKEWYGKYVKSNPQAVQKEMADKNRTKDSLQYEEYRETLGKRYTPATFEEFQRIKYSDKQRYEQLKTQRRSMVYYNRAIKNEPVISGVIKKISSDNQIELAGWEFRIKGKDSYLRKVQNRFENGQSEYQASDIVRYTMVADGDMLVSKLKQVRKDLTALGYETIEVNNFWLDALNPYNGINTVVKAPNGQRFELQYHTPESLEVKEKIHVLYEKKRILQDQESDEALKYDDAMQEMAKSLTQPKNVAEVMSDG